MLTFDLLTWIAIGTYSCRTIYLVPSLKLLKQSVLELSVAQGLGDWYDLWPWPTDLNINRDHLLIKDYLPTKFEASGAKRSWVMNCTRLRETYRHTYILTDMCKYAPPSLKRSINMHLNVALNYDVLVTNWRNLDNFTTRAWFTFFTSCWFDNCTLWQMTILKL